MSSSMEVLFRPIQINEPPEVTIGLRIQKPASSSATLLSKVHCNSSTRFDVQTACPTSFAQTIASARMRFPATNDRKSIRMGPPK
jgi:hypothetical protein